MGKDYYWIGLSLASKPSDHAVPVGALAMETDTGDEYQWTNSTWQRISYAGVPLFRLASAESGLLLPPTDQYYPLVGTAATFAALPLSAGTNGRYPIDLDAFGPSNIYLVVLLATGTATVTATVEYSQGLDSPRLMHPETPATIIATVAGNNSVVIPKRDKFAFVNITLSVAENVCIYVVGRSQA